VAAADLEVVVQADGLGPLTMSGALNAGAAVKKKRPRKRQRTEGKISADFTSSTGRNRHGDILYDCPSIAALLGREISLKVLWR